jgi:hypothetical protein
MQHLEGDDAIVSRDRVGDFKAWLDRWFQYSMSCLRYNEKVTIMTKLN